MRSYCGFKRPPLERRVFLKNRDSYQTQGYTMTDNVKYFPTQAESEFRNERNVRLLKGLFLETGGRESGMYTLRDKDHTSEGKTFVSLRRLYLEEEDVTEYSFANKHMESWEHWQMLLECKWFQEYVTRWRTELELKLKSRALKNIMAEAAGQTKSSFNANKWLAEKNWIDKAAESNRRGRPSKAEINKIAMEEAMSTRQVNDDMKRLGIN